MVDKVIERPSYTPPVAGAESAFVGQLLQTTQQHGYAINQLLGDFEVGTFTPTFDFATPGDLSNVYAAQEGSYWRIGALLHFSIYLDVTPTFSTASGIAQIGGLPYAASTDHPHSVIAARVASAAVTWPGSRTESIGLVSSADASFMRIQFEGSGAGSTSMVAADISSGNAVNIRATGFYPMR